MVTHYCYDALNRPNAARYGAVCTSAPDISYSYDTGAAFSKGRLVSVTNSAAVNKITGYDELGRITGSSQTIGSGNPYIFAHTYNLADALKTEIYPSGRSVVTGYDMANRPVSLTGNSTTNYVSGLTYAAYGGPNLRGEIHESRVIRGWRF